MTMSNNCKCFDIEVDIVVGEPVINSELDFNGEVILCSDGEDYQRGYNEGHAEGYTQGQKDGYENGYNKGQSDGYTTGYDKGKTDGITEGYNNGYEQGKADGYSDGYNEGYSVGYNAGYEKGKAESGIDIFQYATLMNGNIFREAVFPDELAENIYFKIQGLQVNSAYTIGFTFMFAYSNIKNITFEIEKIPQNGITFNSVFHTCKDLLSVTFINNPFYIANGATSFYGDTKLERINGVMDLSLAGNISGMFSRCYALKEVRFNEGSIKKSLSFSDSPNLSNESIDAIINGFADMTGQTAPVLTFHPTVKAKIEADDAKEDTDPTKHFWLKTLTGKNVTLA